MNYKKLDKTIEDLGETKQKLIKKAGLTEPGYYKALKKESMKIKMLEKLTDALGLKMTFWWEDIEDPSNYVKEPEITYGELKSKIQDLERERDGLYERITEMKEKYEVKEIKKKEVG